MYRYSILFLFLLSLVSGIGVWAQEQQPDPTIVANPPSQMITGNSNWEPVELTRLDAPLSPDTPSAGPADDSCSSATLLNISLSGDGGTTMVNGLNGTQDATDPLLTCAWGGQTQGYRTAWYQFTAPHSGRVYIGTFSSNYDTILAVHSGNCGISSLETVACSDDSRGFISEITLSVRKGETYYVEIADWEASAAYTKILNITALMQPVHSLWTQDSPLPSGGLSRHATAVHGDDIYVIGGQTVLGDTANIVPDLWRYDTATDEWAVDVNGKSKLPSMPLPGYSNTTAVYVDGPNDTGRIYLPSGYSGGGQYVMTHWAYDIKEPQWLTQATLPSSNFAWAAAVAVVDPEPGYYLTGGLSTIDSPTAESDVRDDILFFQPIGNATFPDGRWQEFTNNPMTPPRYAHTAALVDGRICVVGGLTYNNAENAVQLLADGECFTPTIGWNKLIPPLNFDRYAAGSAVSPDGKWYVFGGIDELGNAVSETEVYDPANPDAWTVLDISHDLGGSATRPARAWPRGEVVGSTLWAIGGHSAPGGQPLSFVEHIFTPSDTVLIPVVFKDYGEDNRPDDNFGQAHLIKFNQAQYRNFNNSQDYFDVYYFDLADSDTITVKLTQVPSNSNYDIAIYDPNKVLWGEGNNLQGLNESVERTLTAGRYYIVVERVYPGGIPNTADYRLIVEK